MEEDVAGSAGSEASASVDLRLPVYERLESHIILLRSENMLLGGEVKELLDKNTALRKQLMDAFDNGAALEDENSSLRKKLAGIPLHSVSPTRKG